MNETLDFPLPPTTVPYLSERPTAPAATPVAAPTPAVAPAPAPPPLDTHTALEQKVAELEQVVALAKTRVETLGAEKREALERALRLEAELEAAGRREAELLERLTTHEAPRAYDDKTVAELLHRVAALEAVMSQSRAAA